MTMELISKSEIAREKNDRLFLCDACAKGWLSAIEASYVLLHFSLWDNRQAYRMLLMYAVFG
jgi:hypothetical protein